MTECYECSRLAELVAQNTAMRAKLGAGAPVPDGRVHAECRRLQQRVDMLEAENARLRARLGEEES